MTHDELNSPKAQAARNTEFDLAVLAEKAPECPALAQDPDETARLIAEADTPTEPCPECWADDPRGGAENGCLVCRVALIDVCRVALIDEDREHFAPDNAEDERQMLDAAGREDMRIQDREAHAAGVHDLDAQDVADLDAFDEAAGLRDDFGAPFDSLARWS